MYDIHSHALPGIDDGPMDWDTAVNMVRQAVKDGIKGITLTPHIKPGYFEPKKEQISQLADDLKSLVQTEPVELYLGSEITLFPETVLGILSGLYLTINSGRYVLIELPESFSPSNVQDLIFTLTSKEMIPVIAHPERNPRVRSDLNLFSDLVRMGAVGQIDAGSITGYFGADVRKTASEMLSRRLVHIMATDAHSDTIRAPLLSAGVKEVGRLWGRRLASQMVNDLPMRIIRNELFYLPEPEQPKKFCIFKR